MKQVTLMRHAKAAQGAPGQEDRDRPLMARGIADASEVGKQTVDAIPDLVLCSGALRTRETIQNVLRQWPRTPPVEFAEDLYLASAEHIIDRLRALPDDIGSVWVVGHNPDLHELAIRFAVHGGGGERDRLSRFPTSARAAFEFDIDDWQKIGRSRARLTAVKLPD